MSKKESKLEELIKKLLGELGEDPERQGLQRTPARAARSLRFLTAGYSVDVDRIFSGALFSDTCEGMVVVKDIEYFSVCEHHLLPFFGKCHVGYIPRDKIVGLSKIARVVDAYARRLQVQERLTKQVAQAIQKHLDPIGVGVIVEARHLCMMMRGVEKRNSVATSTTMLGAFRDDPKTRSEFLHLVQSRLSE